MHLMYQLDQGVCCPITMTFVTWKYWDLSGEKKWGDWGDTMIENCFFKDKNWWWLDFLMIFRFDLLKALYVSCLASFLYLSKAAVPALAKMDIEDKPHAAFLQRSLEICAVPSESFCYPFVLIICRIQSRDLSSRFQPIHQPNKPWPRPERKTDCWEVQSRRHPSLLQRWGDLWYVNDREARWFGCSCQYDTGHSSCAWQRSIRWGFLEGKFGELLEKHHMFLKQIAVVCNLLSGSLYKLVHYNNLTVKLAWPNPYVLVIFVFQLVVLLVVAASFIVSLVPSQHLL